MMHDHFIISIVKMMGCSKYLELGIYDGYNISQVKNYCDYCLGVDIVDYRRFHNFEFRLSTTDDFFKNNTEFFDIIFIDADHNFEAVKKDFINSLNILNKFGIIMLHDTDPMSEFYLDPGQCNDSYKMIDWLQENYKGLNVMTIPITQAGLTLINRKKDRRVLEFVK
jgi:hypothetical protein